MRPRTRQEKNFDRILIGYYEATKRAQTGGNKWDKHPYFSDPYYWGPAPFPYAFPGEWDDPAILGMWF